MKYLFFLLLATSVFAQHAEQPLPEDTEDARANYKVFELRDLRGHKVYSLERSPYFDHFLKLIRKKDAKLQKADSKLAKSLDEQFSSLYFKTTYEIESKEGKCKEAFELELRGEKQVVCRKDDQKTRLIKSFIELLEKQF